MKDETTTTIAALAVALNDWLIDHEDEIDFGEPIAYAHDDDFQLVYRDGTFYVEF